jgi:hypothetical protein
VRQDVSPPAGAFTEHGEERVSIFFHGQKFDEMSLSS